MPRLHFFVASLAAVGGLRAAAFDERVEALFRSPFGEMLSLSPDGQRLAYTTTKGAELSLVIMSLEPIGPRRSVKIGGERDGLATESAAPTKLRFLRWATSSRLVYSPAERIVPLPPLVDQKGNATPNPDGPTVVSPILLVDLDGHERGTLVDASNFQETPESARRSLADLLRTPQQLSQAHQGPVRWRMPHIDVLGFLPRDREQMVLRTHGAYSMPAQHLVDLRTGDVREFGGDWPVPPGEPLIFDGLRLKTVGEHVAAARPTTHWRDEELAQVQRELDTKFPRRVVELLDWSETRARIAFCVTGGSDAGRIFVWHRPEDIVVEVLQRAPWLGPAKLNPTRFFECDGPDGAKLTGYFTWPAKPTSELPPLLVVFPSGFPGSAQPVFDPEAQVFADLGFSVVRLNHRSVGGVAARDLGPLRAAVDRAAIDDARAALAWLATRDTWPAFDRTHVTALGRGFGGYLAVRAAELASAQFQRAIAIDAPLDLRAWLQPAARGTAAPTEVPAALIAHAGTEWGKLSALDAASTVSAPVLLLVEPGRNAVIDAAAAAWRARFSALGRDGDVYELDAGFAAARPAARASAYRQMEDFLRGRRRNASAGSDAAAKEGP